MAHGTRINGAAYGVTGGKCLVGGTAYSIKKGRTLIGGTGYDINLNSYDPVLNNNTWEQIAEAAQNGLAESVWNVGDTKEITISGSIPTGKTSWGQPQTIDISGTYLCYILGFNHNADLEGANRIHFQLARSTAGKELCFYASVMSNEFGTAGGWESSLLRNEILGTSLTNNSGTFLGALPADLRAVMRTAQKYSDNGSGNFGSGSATTDYLWIPAEKEVFGTVTEGTYGQGEYQAQYAYYAAGGSTIRYGHNDTRDREREWWLRSLADAFSFCYVDDAGNVAKEVPSETFGLAPIFCV